MSRRGANDEAWQGVVVGKHRRLLDGSNQYHHVDVRCDDGVTRSVRVPRALWKSVSDGDRIGKQPGHPPVKFTVSRGTRPIASGPPSTTQPKEAFA